MLKINGWLKTAALLSALAVPGAALEMRAKVLIEGDSTLHPFKATATVVQAVAEGEGAGRLTGLTVVVPVAKLLSGKDGLDKNMHKALKAGEHPEISFKMTGQRWLEPERSVRLSGELAIAGSTRTVALDAEVSAAPGGLRAAGHTTLKMSDFGIKPPKLMMGAIKVRDEIAIRYEAEITGGSQ